MPLSDIDFLNASASMVDTKYDSRRYGGGVERYEGGGGRYEGGGGGGRYGGVSGGRNGGGGAGYRGNGAQGGSGGITILLIAPVFAKKSGGGGEKGGYGDGAGNGGGGLGHRIYDRKAAYGGEENVYGEGGRYGIGEGYSAGDGGGYEKSGGREADGNGWDAAKTGFSFAEFSEMFRKNDFGLSNFFKKDHSDGFARIAGKGIEGFGKEPFGIIETKNRTVGIHGDEGANGAIRKGVVHNDPRTTRGNAYYTKRLRGRMAKNSFVDGGHNGRFHEHNSEKGSYSGSKYGEDGRRSGYGRPAGKFFLFSIFLINIIIGCFS